MSFVAVFTALMSSFVLIAPIAMAVLLVKGPAPQRRTAPALATTPNRTTVEATIPGSRELRLSRAA